MMASKLYSNKAEVLFYLLRVTEYTQYTTIPSIMGSTLKIISKITFDVKIGDYQADNRINTCLPVVELDMENRYVTINLISQHVLFAHQLHVQPRLVKTMLNV